MSRTFSAHRANESCIHSLIEKSQGKIPLGRNRSRYEDNIKTYLRGIGRGLTYKILQRTQSFGLWRRVVCR